MKDIRVERRIDSELLRLPELKPLIGKTVEIVVREVPAKQAATEQDWEAFFAAYGTSSVDPELYKQYREFDRTHFKPPEL